MNTETYKESKGLISDIDSISSQLEIVKDAFYNTGKTEYAKLYIKRNGIEYKISLTDKELDQTLRDVIRSYNNAMDEKQKELNRLLDGLQVKLN